MASGSLSLREIAAKEFIINLHSATLVNIVSTISIVGNELYGYQPSIRILEAIDIYGGEARLDINSFDIHFYVITPRSRMVIDLTEDDIEMLAEAYIDDSDMIQLEIELDNLRVITFDKNISSPTELSVDKIVDTILEFQKDTAIDGIFIRYSGDALNRDILIPVMGG